MRGCITPNCTNEAPIGGPHGQRYPSCGKTYQKQYHGSYKRKSRKVGNTFIDGGIRWHKNLRTQEVVPADVFLPDTF